MCQGCSTKRGWLCDQPPVKNNKDCPCVSCIVKTMCSDMCKDYAIYANIPKYYWEIHISNSI